MNYKIHITRMAEQDLNEAADYISYILKNPDAADSLLDLAEECLVPLSKNSKLHPIVDDAFLKSLGIRFISIKNYLAFYTIDENKKIVYIVRFLLSKRDWSSILRQNISFD